MKYILLSLPDDNIGFISGPSFAAESYKGLSTALVINSKSKDIGWLIFYFSKFIKSLL